LKRARTLSVLFLAITLILALPARAGGDASDGHTHGPSEPVLAQDIAPRATAQTEDFELVAVPAGGKLTLYLDRYVDNAPVSGAVVEVESGAFKTVAKEVAPGVYALPGEAFAKPGKYPLTLSIQAGETADLLTATLDLAALPSAGVEHVHTWGEWAVWGAASALLLAGAGLVAVRRRQKKRGH
jgi:hypothetical protein